MRKFFIFSIMLIAGLVAMAYYQRQGIASHLLDSARTDYQNQKYSVAIKKSKVAIFFSRIMYKTHLPNLYDIRGQAYYKLNDLKNALQDFNLAISKANDQSELSSYYLHRATLYSNSDNPERALNDLKLSIEKKPSGSAFRLMSSIYLNKKEYDEAINCSISAVKLGVPASDDIIKQVSEICLNIAHQEFTDSDYCNAAKYYDLLLEIDDSIRNTNRIVEIYTSYVEAVNGYNKTSQTEKALDVFKKAVNINQDKKQSVQKLINYGLAVVKNHLFESKEYALVLIDNLYKLDPERCKPDISRCLLALMAAKEKQDDIDEAVSALEKLEDYYPILKPNLQIHRERLTCKVANAKLADAQYYQNQIDFEELADFNDRIKSLSSQLSPEIIGLAMVRYDDLPYMAKQSVNFNKTDISNALSAVDHMRDAHQLFKEVMELTKGGKCREAHDMAFRENAEMMTKWIRMTFPLSDYLAVLKEVGADRD